MSATPEISGSVFFKIKIKVLLPINMVTGQKHRLLDLVLHHKKFVVIITNTQCSDLRLFERQIYCTIISYDNVRSKPASNVLFNAHARKAGSTTAKCSLPAVSILVLINNESFHCSGDNDLVNLIHTAVSTLFNLPCIHTPLRFYSRDYNSKHFTGCGWLLHESKRNNTAHFELQELSSHHMELVRVVEKVAMFLLKRHHHLYNMASK